MKTSNNLISFPSKENILGVTLEMPKTDQDIIDAKELVKSVYVYEISEDMINILFNQMSVLGFDIFNEKFRKDRALISESIISFLLKQFNIKHIFQNLNDKLFEEEDDDDKNLRIVKKLKYNFEKGE